MELKMASQSGIKMKPRIVSQNEPYLFLPTTLLFPCCSLPTSVLRFLLCFPGHPYVVFSFPSFVCFDYFHMLFHHFSWVSCCCFSRLLGGSCCSPYFLWCPMSRVFLVFKLSVACCSCCFTMFTVFFLISRWCSYFSCFFLFFQVFTTFACLPPTLFLVLFLCFLPSRFVHVFFVILPPPLWFHVSYCSRYCPGTPIVVQCVCLFRVVPMFSVLSHVSYVFMFLCFPMFLLFCLGRPIKSV